jgi:histidyl-tRNA synthetase
VIIGPDEYQSEKVSVKDLRAGLSSREGIQDRQAFRKAGKSGQQTIALDDLIPTVKTILQAEA